MRRAFTLVEILVCCILLGIGLTSVVALLLSSLQRSNEVVAMTTMGPLATAAACYYGANRLSGQLDLPIDGVFESPFAIRVTRDQAPDDSDAAAALTGDRMITLRVRVYDTPEHRDAEAKCRGEMFIRQYLRPLP